MANTNELKYSKSHEWVRYEGDEAYIGITDFAQSSMGDLVFVNLPEVDDEIEVGEALGDIESVKAVEDVLSPVSATVLEVNEELLDAPEVRVGNITETEELLDEEAYDKFVEEEEA